MKKLICFVLTFVLSMSAMFVVTVNAYNEQDTVITDIVQPRYAYTSSINSNLSISGDKATCTSTVTGISTVTKIEATQYLEKKVLWWWEEVDHWSDTSYTKTLYMNNSKDNLNDGTTYRVKTVATVYCGTDYEIVEDTSE